MAPRGLVLIVGSTGSGKSTTLAAMIDHRNTNTSGHILTIEDPIEYLHKHKKSIVNQREVGLDTHAFHNALKNAMREAPDVILIGEILDATTMEAAIAFAETGHLCLATLHSNNADQTLERILNFFPEAAHKNVLMNLALNLQGGDLAAPGGRQGRPPPAGGRSADQHADDPRPDAPRPGARDQAGDGRIAGGRHGDRSTSACSACTRKARSSWKRRCTSADSRDGLALKIRLSEGAHRRARSRTRTCSTRTDARSASQRPNSPAIAGLCFSLRCFAARPAASPAAPRRRPAAPGTPARCARWSGTSRGPRRSAARCRPAGPGSSRRWSARRPRRSVPVDGWSASIASSASKPVADPVPHPVVALGLRHVPLALEVLQHAQVVERMDVAGDQLRERAHALAVARGGRQQRRRRARFRRGIRGSPATGAACARRAAAPAPGPAGWPRNAGVCCSPPSRSRCTATSSYGRPLRFRPMRTR